MLETSGNCWTRMTQTTMPQRSDVGCGGISLMGGGREGVEVARAIAAKHHPTGPWILNRKAKSVKFNRTIVVTSELTYRKEIANNGWHNKDIIECKVGGRSREKRVALPSDRKRVAITNNNGRRGRNGAESEYTVVGVHVGGSTGVHDPRCAALVHGHLVQGCNQSGGIPLLGRRRGVLQGCKGGMRLGCLSEQARATRGAPTRALPSLKATWTEAKPGTSRLDRLLPLTTGGRLLLRLAVATAATTTVAVIAASTSAAPS
jgi:hypothetical protein